MTHVPKVLKRQAYIHQSTIQLSICVYSSYKTHHECVVLFMMCASLMLVLYVLRKQTSWRVCAEIDLHVYDLDCVRHVQ